MDKTSKEIKENPSCCLYYTPLNYDLNKDDKIHKSEALRRQDKRTLILKEYQN